MRPHPKYVPGPPLKRQSVQIFAKKATTPIVFGLSKTASAVVQLSLPSDISIRRHAPPRRLAICAHYVVLTCAIAGSQLLVSAAGKLCRASPRLLGHPKSSGHSHKLGSRQATAGHNPRHRPQIYMCWLTQPPRCFPVLRLMIIG